MLIYSKLKPIEEPNLNIWNVSINIGTDVVFKV